MRHPVRSPRRVRPGRGSGPTFRPAQHRHSSSRCRTRPRCPRPRTSRPARRRRCRCGGDPSPSSRGGRWPEPVAPRPRPGRSRPGSTRRGRRGGTVGRRSRRQRRLRRWPHPRRRLPHRDQPSDDCSVRCWTVPGRRPVARRGRHRSLKRRHRRPGPPGAGPTLRVPDLAQRPWPRSDSTLSRRGDKSCGGGGGSTYTPELVDSLCDNEDRMVVDDLVLLDPSEERRDAVGGLSERILRARGWGGVLRYDGRPGPGAGGSRFRGRPTAHRRAGGTSGRRDTSGRLRLPGAGDHRGGRAGQGPAHGTDRARVGRRDGQAGQPRRVVRGLHEPGRHRDPGAAR